MSLLLPTPKGRSALLAARSDIRLPDLSPYQMFAKFKGNAAAAGYVADKGEAFTLSGPASATAAIINGQFRQTASSEASYLFHRVPGVRMTRLKGKFIYNPLGGVPVCLALATTDNSTPPKIVHGEIAAQDLVGNPTGPQGFALRLAEDTFYPPSHIVQTRVFQPVAGAEYEVTLVSEGKWAYMRITDPSGTQIGETIGYDNHMDLCRGEHAYWEVLDDKAGWPQVSSETGQTPVWPTLDERAWSDLANTAGGFVNSPFGAGNPVTFADGVQYTSSAYGGGLTRPLGAVNAGDRVKVCFEVTGQTGGNVMTLTGFGVAEVITAIIPVPGFAGYPPNIAKQVTWEWTVPGGAGRANMGVVIGSDGAGSSTMRFRRFTAFVNAPTSVANPVGA